MNSKMKVCPFCAEDIKAAAIVCRYCHRDLPLADNPNDVGFDALEKQTEPIDLGANYLSIQAEIKKSLDSSKSGNETVEDSINKQLVRFSDLDGSSYSKQLDSVREKWADYRSRDLPWEKPLSVSGTMEAISRISGALRDINEEYGAITEKESSKSHVQIISWGQDQVTLTSFKVGLEAADNEEISEISELTENLIGLLDCCAKQLSQYYEALLIPSVFSDEEISRLSAELLQFCRYLSLRFCAFGIATLQNTSKEDQQNKIYIERLPQKAITSLPATITVRWKRNGPLQFFVNANRSGGVNTNEILAMSAPLLMNHQVMSLSPAQIRNLAIKLVDVLKSDRRIKYPIGDVLKEATIRLDSHDQTIVPQFKPKTKFLSTGNSVEEAVVSFLLNYQSAISHTVGGYLATAANISSLAAISRCFPIGANKMNHNLYLMNLATGTWWIPEVSQRSLIKRVNSFINEIK